MSAFTQDNTAGYTDAELVTMNDEYYRELAVALGEIPDGAESANTNLVYQIEQSTAEAVLRRHGGA